MISNVVKQIYLGIEWNVKYDITVLGTLTRLLIENFIIFKLMKLEFHEQS